MMRCFDGNFRCFLSRFFCWTPLCSDLRTNKMIKTLLKSLAWRILDKELRENWIHRAYFNDYAKWMSRDFPVMNDMCEQFQDRPYGGPIECARHREEMKQKYIKN